MKKIIAFVAVFNFAFTFAALAGNEKVPCYHNFYKTKNIACVDDLVEKMHKELPQMKSDANLQAVVGFLAQLFIDYPQVKYRILHQESADRDKMIYLAAIYRSGLIDEAKQYAETIDKTDRFNKYQSDHVPTLKNVKPSSYPSDNDLLIGAYMASGKGEYIKRILENYADTDDETAKIALRMALNMNKFGQNLTPPGRDATLIKEICQKYDCTNNPQNMMRVVTLASGFWSIQSLSEDDDSIKKEFNDFFKNDARLKRLLFEETNAFANYLTMLAAYAGIKDNPQINESLSTYEKLGSAEHVLNTIKH